MCVCVCVYVRVCVCVRDISLSLSLSLSHKIVCSSAPNVINHTHRRTHTVCRQDGVVRMACYQDVFAMMVVCLQDVPTSGWFDIRMLCHQDIVIRITPE